MAEVAETLEVQLGVDDLKELFPELAQYTFNTLVPLFDRLLTGFIDLVEQLGTQNHSMQFCCGSNLTITDTLSFPGFEEIGEFFVVNGSIVRMTRNMTAMFRTQDYGIYSPGGISKITLSGSDEKINRAFLEMINGFMSRQNLYKLRAKIADEVTAAHLRYYHDEQARFYNNVGDEYWVPNMAGGLTPEVVLMTMFKYCDALFPRDWQDIWEEIYAQQRDHKFLTLLGLHRCGDTRLASDIFDKAIQYLLDHQFIYVNHMPPKPVKPKYGETCLRIQGNHKSTTVRDIEKRHHDMIWTPCYKLGCLLTEKFGESL